MIGSRAFAIRTNPQQHFGQKKKKRRRRRMGEQSAVVDKFFCLFVGNASDYKMRERGFGGGGGKGRFKA